MSLLNCAPCMPARLRALPIIDTRFTRLRANAPLLSSISILRTFVLSWVVLCCARYLLCFVCLLQLIPLPLPSPPPVSLLSFILPYKAVYIFFSFILLFKPLVTLLFIQLFCNNIFRLSALFFFLNKPSKHPIFTHSTHGQILRELLRFKH